MAYPPGQPDVDGDGSVDDRDEVGIKHRLDGRSLPDGPNHLRIMLTRCLDPLQSAEPFEHLPKREPR